MGGLCISSRRVTALIAFILRLATQSQAFSWHAALLGNIVQHPGSRQGWGPSVVFAQSLERNGRSSSTSACNLFLRYGVSSYQRRQSFRRGTVRRCGPASSSNADSGLSVGQEANLQSAAASNSSAAQLQPPRPEWLPDFVPDWLVKKRHPLIQLAIMLVLYAFHLLYLSKTTWNFPFQLIPNDRGAFQSIGLDSVAGLLVVAGVIAMRKAAGVRPIPPILATDNPPWRVPREARRKLGGTTGMLLLAYIASGYGAVFCEQVLLIMSVYDVPLTVPTMRAWKVLLGHLMWVYMGIKILGKQHEPFFPPKGTWLRWRTDSNWVWWVTGSYFVSALLFNVADLANQLILPSTVFDEESVVSKLVNPENKDLVAMAVGAIGPCISAPIFEEVLYRGFLLPALGVGMPVRWALPVSAALFSVHHLNLGGVLPLSILGFAWAVIYTQSRNLLVTILIHALWNSRVFLGSFRSLFVPPGL